MFTFSAIRLEFRFEWCSNERERERERERETERGGCGLVG